MMKVKDYLMNMVSTSHENWFILNFHTLSIKNIKDKVNEVSEE